TIGILKASDIVINPSYTEGLPTSVIEAALCGKPIIATTVGGTIEILDKNTGILIPAKNSSAITEKIEYLAENKDLRVLIGGKVKNKIERKFSWKKATEKYVELLTKNG
ncbi:MAG: Glycosyltransferase, partial [candidate division WWE3 bacterium GW2011_GWF2_41_45]